MHRLQIAGAFSARLPSVAIASARSKLVFSGACAAVPRCPMSCIALV